MQLLAVMVTLRFQTVRSWRKRCMVEHSNRLCTIYRSCRMAHAVRYPVVLININHAVSSRKRMIVMLAAFDHGSVAAASRPVPIYDSRRTDV